MRDARIAFVSSLITVALSMFVSAVWDPFGLESDRADDSARRATAYVLCSQGATYEVRLAQIRDNPEQDDLQLVLEDGIRRNQQAERVLGIVCPDTAPLEP